MNKVYGYDTNIYETSIGNIKYFNEEKYIEMLEDGNLYDYIKDLQKKAELGEHYKHLYSKVKKQKDDVVEAIKGILEVNEIYKIELKTAPFYSKKWVEDICNDLLRMLGEIDEQENNSI